MPARFALITDPHYARRPAENDKRFADSLDKLRQAVVRFNEAGIDTLVVLGDLVDEADSADAERAHLLEVREALDAFAGTWHLTPGNHDLMNFDKAELYELMGKANPPYAVDADGLRLLLLDGCFRPDGVPYAHGDFDWKQACIGGGQIEWLRQQLQHADEERRRAVVCCHHPLVSDDERYVAHNADDAISVLTSSPATAAYLCGHHHKGGAAELRGVPHVTLKAMSDSAPSATQGVIVTLGDDGVLRIDGSM